MKIALVALAGMVLVGCGGGGAPATVTVSATPSTASASATPTVTSTPTVSADPRSLKVGQTFTDDVVKVTVEKVALDQRGSLNGTYSGAMVKMCLVSVPEGQDAVGFSWVPWTMVGDDGSRYQNLGESGGSLPTPTYPNGEQDGIFRKGDCTRGWIFFNTPKGVTASAVRYQPAEDEPVMWAVK